MSTATVPKNLRNSWISKVVTMTPSKAPSGRGQPAPERQDVALRLAAGHQERRVHRELVRAGPGKTLKDVLLPREAGRRDSSSSTDG